MPNIYKTPSELPDPEAEGNKLWIAASSPELRELVVFQLINELSTSDSLAMTDGQCRSKLAKCEGIVKMMFLLEAKTNTDKAQANSLNKTNTHDILPED